MQARARSRARSKRRGEKIKFFIWLLLFVLFLVWFFWPEKERDLIPEQPPEVRQRVPEPRTVNDVYGMTIYKYARDHAMSINVDNLEMSKVTIPSMSGASNEPIRRSSPEDPIILRKSWMEFYMQVARLGKPELCDSGKDYVLNWNNNLLIRCRAMVMGDPSYCSFFDKQPNAKMDSIIFQQICMYDVFRLQSNKKEYKQDTCESMLKYPNFLSIYFECRALVSRDVNFCVSIINMSPVGQVDFGPSAGIRCMATLAGFLRSEEICKLAREYEAYYLEDGTLKLPMDDELYNCPGVF
jgi:hypothetical protein